MNSGHLHIEVFDCLAFNNSLATADVIQNFIKTQYKNIFWFSFKNSTDNDSKLAEFDYRTHQWYAGRFIGEACFRHNGNDYKITIKPRFGESFLFEMLEEIYNIRITSSASKPKNDNDWQHYIKRIISFIWLQKLANANLHGLPKFSIKKSYKGQSVKGRVNIRQSIKPYYKSNELVSEYYEKVVEETIARIIYQAYKILKSEFQLGLINIPDSAQEALNQVQSISNKHAPVTEIQYRNIRYKDIYLSWKQLVDLSWDIIRRKKLSLKQENSQNGFGFFIDMAEIWEQFLRVTLKKHLTKKGWKIRNTKEIAYKNYFFQRQLIPDLVFQKGNEIAVWDAKYKRMLGRYFDVDRTDFFQIHTYLLNYLKKYTLKAGGLLYPISDKFFKINNYTAPWLINDEGQEMKFSIDGIELQELETNESSKNSKNEFINRIYQQLQ